MSMQPMKQHDLKVTKVTNVPFKYSKERCDNYFICYNLSHGNGHQLIL